MSKENIRQLAIEALRDTGLDSAHAVLSGRISDMAESIQSLLLFEDREDFQQLMQAVRLQHEMEMKAVYKKGIQQGAYFQRLICGEKISHASGKAGQTLET